jgi:hypothetical protein
MIGVSQNNPLYCSAQKNPQSTGVQLIQNLDPAYGAYGGYYDEAEAAESGCGFWQNLWQNGGQAVSGAAATILVAGGGAEAATDLLPALGVGGAGEAESLASRSGSTGGIGPVLQGEAGVDQTSSEIEAAGGQILGREITLDVDGIRTRPDLFVRLPNGQEAFVEVKTGGSAALTANQSAAFPGIRAGGAVPVGANAAAAGLTPGVPLGPTPVWVVRQPWPLPGSP